VSTTHAGPGGAPPKPVTTRPPYAGAVHLGLIAVVVSDYDPAISFFVDALGFELVEDSPSLTNDGRPKRWVVVRPPGVVTGLLLARADGEDQAAAVGKQAAGRVGFSSTWRISMPCTHGWHLPVFSS
jgi:catechol 2,3-dioxygenase-like lactoylglutathione lyase family enzyme